MVLYISYQNKTFCGPLTLWNIWISNNLSSMQMVIWIADKTSNIQIPGSNYLDWVFRCDSVKEPVND